MTLPGFLSYLIFAGNEPLWNWLRKVQHFPVCFCCSSLFKGGFHQIKICFFPSQKKKKRRINHYKALSKYRVSSFKTNMLINSSSSLRVTYSKNREEHAVHARVTRRYFIHNCIRVRNPKLGNSCCSGCSSDGMVTFCRSCAFQAFEVFADWYHHSQMVQSLAASYIWVSCFFPFLEFHRVKLAVVCQCVFRLKVPKSCWLSASYSVKNKNS